MFTALMLLFGDIKMLSLASDIVRMIIFQA